MRALLSYFFSSLKINDLENISLVEIEILGVFVNILNVDDKHPVGDCENLQCPSQMQLS